MSLGLRLATLVGLVIICLSGLGALLRSGEERSMVTESALGDRRLLGRVVAETLWDPTHLAQRSRTLRALVRAEHGEADVELVAPGTSSERTGAMSDAQRARLAAHEVVALATGDRLMTYVPLADGAMVIIDEPHALDEALARTSLAASIAGALLISFIAWVISVMLIDRFVRRPVARLAEQARRIGQGDLSVRLPVHGNDEIAQLVRETNAMVDRLEQTRGALVSAEAERLSLMESMRHADRLRSVGELAASLAHELGTPLNTVAGHARLVERSAGADEAAHKSARIIGEQTVRMTKLIRQLLDFSRQKTSERAPRDLVTLVNEAAEMLAPMAHKAGVRVEIESPPAPVMAHVDEGELLQVLTNLVVNALHASRAGQVVSISVESEAQSAPHGVPPSAGGFAQIRVRDEGAGISDEVLAHVFEPFFTSKPVGEGTGLGLPVARGIVIQHGGSLDIVSGGRGTCLTVRLPKLAQSGGETFPVVAF